MEKNQRVFGLDLFRIAAIAMLMLSQCLWLLPNLNPLISQVASVIYFFGLEIFFVLNGYLLYVKLYPLYFSTDFGWSSVVYFLKRRLLHILPLYFLMLILNLLMAVVLNQPFSGIWKYFFLLQNFNSPMPGFFHESWGLPIILFADALFVVLLFLLNQFVQPKSKQFSFLGLTVLLIAFAFLLRWIYNLGTMNTNVTQWDVALKSVAIYRFDAVYVGIFMGWLLGHFDLFLRKFRVALAGIGLLGFLFFLFGVGFFQLLIESHPLFWNVFYLPLASLIIGCFLPLFLQWKATHAWLQNAVLRLARCSFAAYLLSVGLLLGLIRDYIIPTGILPAIILLPLYIVLTVFLAAAIEHFYQRKFVASAPQNQ